MISLRALGFGSYPIAPLERFLTVVHVALAINVASGLTLFVIQAPEFFYSPTFRVKMLLIVAGLIAGALLNDRLFGAKARASGGANPVRSTKVIAGISLVCWAGAIAAGRMTAYLP
ncbi:MAG TPA: hypothetical protein VKQ06_00825, partial [Gammaproteobacteria bacterium]|nr:hypothetical protein [Gammaproteobacteria bacterium]